MTRYNDAKYRYLSDDAGYGMPIVVRPEMPRSYPFPPAGHSFGAGFNAGFCDGIGKFVGLASKVLPFIRGFRKGV